MGHGSRITSPRASQQGGPYRVTVGVTGGIAAYKACTLVRLLLKQGMDVTVVPTDAALEMVGRTTWEALTGKPVYTRTSEGAADVTHVAIGQHSDLIIVAPTTANTLAKVRAGIADNLLTSTILAARCPVILAPAMHTEMWLNAATQDNVRVLRERGITVIDPAVGQLTGPDSGPGRLPEPEDLAQIVHDALTAPLDFTGVDMVISAGGTRESLDPVRFLGNRSSGAFGVAIAERAVERGAHVTLVAANVDQAVVSRLSGATIISVVSTADLHAAMDQLAASAQVVIQAAAVADYRPAAPSSAKIKKQNGTSLSIELIENPDILADLAAHRRRPGQIIVGFAAETGDDHGSVIDYGKKKAAAKGADLMVINEVGEKRGFGDVDTAITIVDAAGTIHGTGAGSKREMADVILNAIATH